MKTFIIRSIKDVVPISYFLRIFETAGVDLRRRRTIQHWTTGIGVVNIMTRGLIDMLNVAAGIP
jgi:hypothetical protein